MNEDNLICIYRYSDGGQRSPDGRIQNKNRPEYFSKQKNLINFLKHFNKDSLIIVADNVTDDSMSFLKEHIQESSIIKTSFKSGALSFLYCVDYVLKTYTNDETIIYFVEDDYIHRANSKQILLQYFLFCVFQR